jgi:multiple sugar transport system permease protein
LTASTQLPASSAAAPPRPKAARPQVTRLVSTTGKYLLLLLFTFFFILPWAWMLSTSLKNPDELAVYPIVWIPSPIRWDNYVEALRQANFLQYMVNTLTIAVPSVIGAVLSNSLIAYGFSRVRWIGRDAVFVLVLATLILPSFVTFIPLYLIFKNLNWINTYYPLIVPVFLGNPFFIFLLRQFFMTLPEELSDAARVDGASDLRIFAQVILPLAKPALAVVALFQFIGSWNDYFGPLVFINDSALYTLSLGIANMRAAYGFSNSAWIMAASVMSVVPLVVLFFFTQRTFIEGIAMTGLKG